MTFDDFSLARLRPCLELFLESLECRQNDTLLQYQTRALHVSLPLPTFLLVSAAVPVQGMLVFNKKSVYGERYGVRLNRSSSFPSAPVLMAPYAQCV